MSYESALRAGGATVFDFQSFGSYQGDWLALVEFNGVRGFVHGSFGSCSDCDAWESEFGDLWNEDHCDAHDEFTHDCAACAERFLYFKAKVEQFGLDYLREMKTHAEALKGASRNLDWDSNAKEMVDWINKVWAKHE